MNRLQRFYYRFLNQHRIHHHNFSVWEIIKIAWIQSKNRKESRNKFLKTSIKTLIKKDDTRTII